MTRDPRHAISRRALLAAGGVLLTLPLLEACAGGGAGGADADTLIVGITADPTTLTAATTSAGTAQTVSTKIFDGLLGYATDLKPVPRLAQSWQLNADNRELTLKLRPGVKWHDGRDFTSADVAFSALKVWRVYHSRGRSTFANLVAVDTPDPLTAVLRFSKPTPYIVSALASNESQVIPRHVYEGQDILSNPANIKPVGTGPFRFVEWERGQYVRLERNPDYWDEGKPRLSGIIFRVLGDSASHAVALETGEIHFTNAIAPGDRNRIAKLANVRVDERNYGLVTSASGLEFNLDLPKLQDVRVRRAIAHAIDRDFVLKNILYGDGVIDTGPIPAVYKAFHSDDVPLYPYDPAKATALLDEAGLKPDASGTRLSFILDPTPGTDRSIKLSEYIRSALAKVGIKVQLRNQDFATFVKRVYTDRDFEVVIAGGQVGPDPAIGVQRFFWSKNFQKGVAFSNASHYASPEADRFLEDAQTEIDPATRRALYAGFQKVVQTDLPRIPLFTSSSTVFYSARLSPMPDNAEGTFGNFGTLQLTPA
ncbi:ABC transporter substrate-binding protein [Sphingobium sufflavum]|uniref:ABC transporter substrate-binding protein n=1 Tax=Sphingobium sufflavum TaxID=1129547 RepID=UPI001F2C1481|nr:ABC transporter substrate-binding protein [Sphingobium sufflavum]MCE7796154.1 ABC transporter substrate-binding protein [Sphingobium sufflavum]